MNRNDYLKYLIAYKLEKKIMDDINKLSQNMCSDIAKNITKKRKVRKK